MRIVFSIILPMIILPFAAVADSQRFVFGAASDDGVGVVEYGVRERSSMITTYVGIEEVAGFEGCEIQSLADRFFFLVCNDRGEVYELHTPTRVGNCRYWGLHRDDGHGLFRTATWDAWSQAACACGEVEERLHELRRRMADPFWARDRDKDPRYE